MKSSITYEENCSPSICIFCSESSVTGRLLFFILAKVRHLEVLISRPTKSTYFR